MRNILYATLIAVAFATPANALALKWHPDQVKEWHVDPRGGIDITMAPIKPSPPAHECMEYWHGSDEEPIGVAGEFRRDKCS